MKSKGVTTQMKALDEYFPMVVITLLLNKPFRENGACWVIRTTYTSKQCSGVEIVVVTAASRSNSNILKQISPLILRYLFPFIFIYHSELFRNVLNQTD